MHVDNGERDRWICNSDQVRLFVHHLTVARAEELEFLMISNVGADISESYAYQIMVRNEEVVVANRSNSFIIKV